MGGHFYHDDDYQQMRTSYKSKSTDQIFTQNISKQIKADMSPKGLQFRESRDSDVHPNSIAIAVFLDVTGSMGSIPEFMIREKLGTLMTTLINHKVPDAHVLFGGIGDHRTDQAPLQVGQFEAGAEQLNQWITGLYLEGRGGGQGTESYPLAWLIGARHTSIDCWEKRQQKGFLFTIGDEGPVDTIDASKLKDLMGYKESEEVSAEQLLQEVQRTYHVFHIHCQEGDYRDSSAVFNAWKKLLNERFLVLEDKNLVTEIIASTVALSLGADADSLYKTLGDSTALVIKDSVNNAISNIRKDLINTNIVNL